MVQKFATKKNTSANNLLVSFVVVFEKEKKKKIDIIKTMKK
jgi:hypothetical protein